MSPEIHLQPTELIYAEDPRQTLERGAIACSVDHRHHKEQALVRRFNDLLHASTDSDLASGINPNKVRTNMEQATNGFSAATVKDKKAMFQHAQAEFTSRLHSTFVSNLSLYDELQAKTNGGSTIEIADDYAKSLRDFHRTKLPEKLLMTLIMKDKAEDFLLSKFDYLLSVWRVSLTEMGATEDEVEGRITALEDKFLNAQKIGQVGIAKALKENIDTASRASFSHMLQLYAELRDQVGITEEGANDFPSIESYNKRYVAASYKNKGEVTDSIENRIRKLFLMLRG